MSVSLLDFDPTPLNTELPPPDVKEMVRQDSWYNCTPDMTTLRYAGPQYVFLWDELQNVERWSLHLLDQPEDIRCDLFIAFTKDSWLPFKNLLGQKDQARSHLILDNKWPRKVRDVDAGAFTSLTPKPVSGKLVSCSLKAIRTFDLHYCNTVLFDRIKMPIVNPARGNVVQAWVYVNKLSQVCKYDPHEMKYKFDSTQDMVPFPVSYLHDRSVFDAAQLNHQEIDQGVLV